MPTNLRLVLWLLAGVALLAALASQALRLWDWRADDEAWVRLQAAAGTGMGSFDPAMVAGLPEIARRYFAFSIAPGTPLKTLVELEMSGQFLLGSRQQPQIFEMRAKELLRPPAAFLWRPQIGAGLMAMDGSDGLVEGRAWTRFWLLSVAPIVRASSSPDLVRSAAGRVLLEAIWAPAGLLPQNGARWRAVAADRAEISFDVHGETLTMTLELTPEGRPLEVSTQRWSNANPERQFRWQPFGGTLRAFASFEGYTIPVSVEVGNQFGTPDFFPFFRARIDSAHYR